MPEQNNWDRGQLLYAVADYTFSRYQLRSFDFTPVPLPQGEALAIHPSERTMMQLGMPMTWSKSRRS